MAADTKETLSRSGEPEVWLVLLLPALAGALGWGIRGQYGHETGAMIPGVLVGLTLVLLLCPKIPALTAVRAVALLTLGMSVGGAMTYGQTIGLTQDAVLIGNWGALRWGLFGLFLKGGIWIGLAGALLGLALSETRYRAVELGLLVLVMVFLAFAGLTLLNMPFDPANHKLPLLYFSEHWEWKPDQRLQPRAECWGGLLVALLGLVLYSVVGRRDALTWRLAGWGFLAGGVGFFLGQSVQVFHAWNPQLFAEGKLAKLDASLNWWNIMETIFGGVFGALLALGVWLNRHLIKPVEEREPVELTPGMEWMLLAVHLTAILFAEFYSSLYFDYFMGLGLTMILIPVPAVAAGRLWPYFLTLPVVLAPIAGKTFRTLCLNAEQLPLWAGALLYVALPVVVTTAAAILLSQSDRQKQPSILSVRTMLLLTTWLYFLLNFAMFDLPLPWKEWTPRTLNNLVFSVCAVVLTVGAVLVHRQPANAGQKAKG